MVLTDNNNNYLAFLSRILCTNNVDTLHFRYTNVLYFIIVIVKQTKIVTGRAPTVGLPEDMQQWLKCSLSIIEEPKSQNRCSPQMV